ncbi:restriction endonuclease [Methylomonas lenta]|uniref:Restriction endonuclease n=1 Tax=Methylomonas lenta TaxID=980561 RepID=A0A177MVD8_9GAMM|nr:restriction endonuclease [Methylomonas lenta]OAI09678.1 restriction endonuclease [Methylomonas lenta]
MSLWLVRAGSYGEHESKFIDENRVYLTWGELTANDMTSIPDYEGIKQRVLQTYPGELPRKLGNWSGQIWAFVLAMKVGDWVVLPNKNKPTIAIGEIKSPCKFDPAAADDYRHYREITWLNTEIPRTAFDQDLLYSFGAFLTICEIKRNNAEQRVRSMAHNQWQTPMPVPTQVSVNGSATDEAPQESLVDLEQLARDSIAKLIIQKFKGHGMARLVDSILKAQGFTTYLSPEGPDKGVDILAAGGPFGFDSPRLCVQVKSGDTPADRPEFTQLIGAMQSVNADQGLFVSWSDFKQTVYKEVPVQFFKVRLWNQNDLIEQLLDNYDKLDQDVRAELPLKRIWTIATPDR